MYAVQVFNLKEYANNKFNSRFKLINNYKKRRLFIDELIPILNDIPVQAMTNFDMIMGIYGFHKNKISSNLIDVIDNYDIELKFNYLNLETVIDIPLDKIDDKQINISIHDTYYDYDFKYTYNRAFKVDRLSLRDKELATIMCCFLKKCYIYLLLKLYWEEEIKNNNTTFNKELKKVIDYIIINPKSNVIKTYIEE